MSSQPYVGVREPRTKRTKIDTETILLRTKFSGMRIDKSDRQIQTRAVNIIEQVSYMNMISGRENEKASVMKLKQGTRDMIEDIRYKDEQLFDQNELIILLVQKLFFVYKTLKGLDEETVVMKMEEEQNTLLNKIKNLEAENEMMKESILKTRKHLQKLEDKAENYLEERDDIKRKHRESLELIETLQKENIKSKETLQTLEDKKNATAEKIQHKVVKELEDYEKKHQECMKKLGSLRMELEKTKQENQASVAKIRNLSDQNKSQADEVASLQEKLQKLNNKSSTVSTGTTCKVCQKDAAVDSQSVKTKNVGVSNVPETRNTATWSDLESQIVPVNDVHELNNPCPGKTANNKPESTYTVGKPPGIKKKETVHILEILEPMTLDAYGCGMNAPPDAFDFVNTKYTATADSKSIKQLLQLEMIDSTNAVYDPTYKQNIRELEITRDSKNVPRTEKTEVLYNSKNMCQSSNESIPADYKYISNILDDRLSEIPPKTVRIDTKPIAISTNEQISDLSMKTSSESLMYQTALDTSSKPVELDFQKKEVGQLEFVKKKAHIHHAPITYRKSSPKRSASPASTATENLQNVVHDLNESVSRIIEKSPNEKATRQRISQLEEQLRLALKQKEHDVENERRRRNKEVENLKLTINEMEKALQNKDANTVNLQSAVDLYLNSISVLEQSEERFQKEVNRQRITIVNLQEAVVSTKHQLDELRVKYNKELEGKDMLYDLLDQSFDSIEKTCYHYHNQHHNALVTIEYLRDELLDLEVEKFNLIQDLSVLESRLLKYQQLSRQYECICGLKKEVKKLHGEVSLFKAEVENLQNYIKRCHYEIDSTRTILGKYLGQQCSEYCIKQDESVLTLAQDTISYTEDLQCQLAVLETALKREQKINMVQVNRIEELQNIIGAKNLELNRANDAYHDMKSKLDTTSSRTKMLEDSIQELKEQLKDMEMDNMFKEEKADICHGELDICLDNLQSLKFRLRLQQAAMLQKKEECSQLEAQYKIALNNAEVYKRDLENTRIRCRDEIIDLKQNIRDQKEKILNLDNKIDSVTRELKESQALLVEASQRESKMKHDYLLRETQLTDKIHSSQEEEMRLLDVVTQLEQQILDLKHELNSKDSQLELAKNTVLQLTSDGVKTQQLSQDEVNTLKNEINSLIQKQGVHKADNERLQQQVECMKCCIQQHEALNKNVKQQLDKCLNDLKVLESDKFFLEQANMKLMETLDKLQTTIHNKTESIASMEIELIEAQNNRDEICSESRNVVCNVKMWLEEQKRINEQLKDKLEQKNAMIAKYQQEKRKCRCNRDKYPRQRGGGALQLNYFRNNQRPINSPCSLDSQESESDRSSSSVSSTPADWNEVQVLEHNAFIQEGNPDMWIQRVECITEELQRSNRYWKRRINDSEYIVTKDSP